LLLGLYTSILEHDNRLILPDDVRVAYKDGLYITQGFDRNIMVLTVQAFEAIYNRIMTFNLADPLARLLLRMILSSAHKMEVGRNGEIFVPSPLKEFGAIDQSVVIVGQGDFIELWSPETWKEQIQRLLAAEADRFSTLNLSTR
jgi:transcriptional regulator MraZ